MNRKQLIKIAQEEIDKWPTINRGLLVAILHCFIHKIIEGESLEETLKARKASNE